MNIDLHSHTNYSDGELHPNELIERALENKVKYLAITDHDTTAALDNVTLSLVNSDLTLIPGVEISTNWDNLEIHILGLHIERSSEEISTLLLDQQQKRKVRSLKISKALEAVGIHGCAEYLDSLNCVSRSRNHIAQFLVDQGKAKDKRQAFKKYLGKKGKVHHKSEWCSIESAITAIRAAGGLAVLAHPGVYGLGKAKLGRLITEFSQHGGAGMEVSCPSLPRDQLLKMATLCMENDLWASVGSDFHSPAMPWSDVGRTQSLPPLCKHREIWNHPAWPGPTTFL